MGINKLLECKSLFFFKVPLTRTEKPEIEPKILRPEPTRKILEPGQP